MPTLIAAGEFFHDFIFFDLERLPVMGEELKTDSFQLTFGGGAAITAVAASLLGRAAEIVTVFGDSPLDADARQRLARVGVSDKRSAVASGSRAGLTVSVSTRDDRYFLTNPGANSQVESHLLEPETLRAAGKGDHLHFALTPTRWEPFQDLVVELKKRSATTSWDMGWDPRAASGRAFARLRATLDVLFLNQMEAIRYTDSSDLEGALQKLSQQQNTVVVKLGSRGAVACQGVEQIWAEPVPVDALETTGAGDAFNGGFLHFWMNGSPLSDCLLAGNICGAASTLAPGGIESLPSRKEFQSRWDALQRG